MTWDQYWSEILKGSKFVKDIEEMKRSFDKSTKCSFRDPADPHFIRGCGSARDRDPKLKVTAGKLRLEGYVNSIMIFIDADSCRSDVASFFAPAIKCIIDGVSAQSRTAHKPIKVSNRTLFVERSLTLTVIEFKSVFLVGGFSANDYLFKRIKDALEMHDLRVYRPDTHL